MESKTMGAFIAALRKASGMTQKDLAEKLGVSDKSVSRWERDDGAPDLALIPVIAEVFGITCDELLRGERRPPDSGPAADTLSPKATRQHQRILAAGLARARSRSLIAMGIAAAGLITAMVCDLACNRAWLGFFLLLAFCLAAGVCQGIFLNSALLAVDSEGVDPDEAGRFRRTVIGWAGVSFAADLILAAFALPLVLFPADPYWGLDFGTWLGWGLLFAAIALVLCAALSAAVHSRLLRRGVYALPPAEEARRTVTLPLRRRHLGILAALWAVTFAGNAAFASVSVYDLAFLTRATVFDDYASYAAFMEQDVPAHASPDAGTAIEALDEPAHADSPETGSASAPDSALTNSRGEILCTYTHRNHGVVGLRYSEDAEGGLLPISVITRDDLDAVRPLQERGLILFAASYVIEGAAVLLLWRRRLLRARKSRAEAQA